SAASTLCATRVPDTANNKLRMERRIFTLVDSIGWICRLATGFLGKTLHFMSMAEELSIALQQSGESLKNQEKTQVFAER
ncbi:hypothetical protein, partial [Pseudomonas piscis]|uniref:hypothetical protein n=1 Tax=Pseudomonas piscis TaxID=2614538 RepID=UPI001F24FF74